MPAVASDSPHKSLPPRSTTFRRGMFITALLSGSVIVVLGLGVFDRVEIDLVEPPSNAAIALDHAQPGSMSVIERVAITEPAVDVSQVTAAVVDSKSTGSTDEPSLKIGESLLQYVLWDLEKNVGTVPLLLAHPLFNPKKIALSAPARRELDTLLERIKKEVREVERPMIDRRFEVLVDRWRQGALAPAPRSANGDTQPPKSSDPEVETGICGSLGSSYSYALKWGDDVTLDQLRLEVYETKQRAVDSLVAFVASHAP